MQTALPNRAVDSPVYFFVMWRYTGKEVVGCKVQIVIVVPDQVRWLRLRAVALRGVPVDPFGRGKQGHSLATIREYGLNRRAHAVPGTGVSEGPRE